MRLEDERYVLMRQRPVEGGFFLKVRTLRDSARIENRVDEIGGNRGDGYFCTSTQSLSITQNVNCLSPEIFSHSVSTRTRINPALSDVTQISSV